MAVAEAAEAAEEVVAEEGEVAESSDGGTLNGEPNG